KNQELPNLELKGLKIQSIKGPLSLKELQYCIRSKYKGTLRSKRCETAYQRYLRTKPIFINKNDQSRKIRLNNYPYNLHHELQHFVMWYHGEWDSLIEYQRKHVKKCEEILNKKIQFSWITPKELRSNPIIPHIHLIINK